MRIGFLLVWLFHMYLGVIGQNLYDYSIQNQPIKKAIQQLSSQTKTPIAFSSRSFDTDQQISLSLTDASVQHILEAILSGTKTRIIPKGKGFVIKREQLSSYVISGYVTDGESGERLIQAAVFVPALSAGVLTNEYGFFSLDLPKGVHEVKIAYTGYSPSLRSLTLDQNKRLSIALEPNLNLDEVLITSDRSDDWGSGFAQMGLHSINTHSLSLMPNVLGESDLVQQVRMLPGVQTSADGFGGLHVRGGDQSQNLIMLDGVPIYNPSHLLGLFSVFNTQAIRTANLHSGGFSSKYGGRLSSVLDIHTKEGNLKSWHTQAGIGLMSGNILVEGPIAKEVGAVLVSARSTLFDQLMVPTVDKLFPGNEFDEDPSFGFYDLNAKINYTFSPSDRVYLSFYQGKDRLSRSFVETDLEGFFLEEERRLNWGNQIFSARWNHLYSPKLFSNLTLAYSRYDFQRVEYSYIEEIEEDEGNEDLFFQELGSQIQDLSASLDFTYYPSQRSRIQFGGSIGQHYMVPQFSTVQIGDELLEELEEFDVDDLISLESGFSLEAWEGNVYTEYRVNPNKPLDLTVGTRLSFFHSDNTQYIFPEPRFQLNYSFNDSWQLQLGANRMVQYLHQIGEGLGMPSDVWIPSGEGIEPQRAWQQELGLQYKNEGWRFRINGYLKQMDHLYFFSDELDQIDLDGALQEEVAEGSGTSQGVELSVERRSGKTQGAFHYTLSQSKRNFPFLNLGNDFPYLYDNRHRISISLTHTFGPKFSLSMNWNYASGLPQFIIINQESTQDLLIVDPNPLGSRNELRNKPIHHLDVGTVYSFHTNQMSHTIKVGVYNAYNRENTSFFRASSIAAPNPTEISLLPVLPSLRYTLSF